jgi:soluble lytic murein transglycosylase-like protein
LTDTCYFLLAVAKKPTTRSPPPQSAARPKSAVRQSPARKKAPQKFAPKTRAPVVFYGVEALALLITALILTISVLGRAANWFGGSDLAQSLLPFAGSVVFLAVLSAGLLTAWFFLRRRLRRLAANVPAIVAVAVLLISIVYAGFPAFQADLFRLRSLVGGVAQAGRDSIAHQVYAAYRRSDLDDLALILSRVAPYARDIQTAARRYRVDPEILIGIGVAESSFLPRDSKDGGKGLFQITAVPKSVSREVAETLAVTTLDPRQPRDNIYLAAATFHHYLEAMKGDLFLGLLAYNIGPRNGGLISIMAQYGARDFFTIQPYLKDLPRDYPIRVLTAALAYRLYAQKGGLPRYEEGENARVIQALGIPGLDLDIPELKPGAKPPS